MESRMVERSKRWGRRTDTVTIERDIKRKNSENPEKYFHNKYSAQSIWNCKEERDNTKQHVQYVDCRKEKQINNE